MGQSPHLFCFGLGYSATFLARRLLARGWRVSGTCRRAEKQAKLKAGGIDAHPFPDAWRAAADDAFGLDIPPQAEAGVPRDAVDVIRRAVDDSPSAPTIVTRETSAPTIETWGTSAPRIETCETSAPRIETCGSSAPRINGNTAAIPLIHLSGLRWSVTITDDQMSIGCQSHKLADWWAFDDRAIAAMDGKYALKFWREHKAALQGICAATGRDAGTAKAKAA